jgi:porphobilinogen synthase
VRLGRIQQNRPRIGNILTAAGLRREQLIMPLIIYERRKIKQNDMITAAVPDCEDDIFRFIYNGLETGIRSFILFGVPNTRDSKGSGASNSQGIVQRSARRIRDEFGTKVLIITDVCICQYNESGHCGITNYNNKYVENDATLRLLSKIAVSHAESGADIISPSSMMDGQVYSIRRSLNENGFKNVKLMPFSAKHSSNLYAPFRALAFTNALKRKHFIDKSNYQLSYCNQREALREIIADINEGADIVMVKPTMAYLDLLPMIRDNIGDFPTALQLVSGESAMIKAAAEHTWIDESEWIVQSIASAKRAGADKIITYSCLDIARYLS